MHRNTLALAALVLALAGCVTIAPPVLPTAEQVDPERAANGDKLVCSRERTTGSNIPEQVCRWASDKALSSVESQRWLSRLKPQPAADRTTGMGTKSSP